VTWARSLKFAVNLAALALERNRTRISPGTDGRTLRFVRVVAGSVDCNAACDIKVRPATVSNTANKTTNLVLVASLYLRRDLMDM